VERNETAHPAILVVSAPPDKSDAILYVLWDFGDCIPLCSAMRGNDFEDWYFKQGPGKDMDEEQARENLRFDMNEVLNDVGEDNLDFLLALKSFNWKNAGVPRTDATAGISVENFWAMYGFDTRTELGVPFTITDRPKRHVRPFLRVVGPDEEVDETEPDILSATMPRIFSSGVSDEDFDADAFDDELDARIAEELEGLADDKDINEAVVAHLEELLGRAMRGEIQQLLTLHPEPNNFNSCEHTFAGGWPLAYALGFLDIARHQILHATPPPTRDKP